MTIVRCLIKANSAYRGAGIHCDNSDPDIKNSTISENTASYGGGGIYCNYSDPALTNCTITLNTANDDNGGIYCTNSSPTIIDCNITGNITLRNGGGIYCRNRSSPTITSCTIDGNSALSGGGIYCRIRSCPTITNCTVSENSVNNDGGGIYCVNSEPAITDCTFSKNHAANGGGIYCLDSEPPIIECTFSKNNAAKGGGIFCNKSEPAITNCTISENTASYGGGVYCDDDDAPVITNCTISNNTASGPYGRGGGLYCFANSHPEISNSILWGDSPEEIYIASGSVICSYSDIQGGWPGEGNIDLDPCFTVGEWNDYRLRWGSSCIDAGNPDKTDPDDTRVDMGAFFFDQSRELIVYLSPESTEISPGESGKVLCTICNSKDYEINFGAAAGIVLPDGSPWPGNPIEEPVFLSIGPGRNRDCEFEYQVPLRCPQGIYSLHCGVRGLADFGNVLRDEFCDSGLEGLLDTDRFFFTVDENSCSSQ